MVHITDSVRWYEYDVYFGKMVRLPRTRVWVDIKGRPYGGCADGRHPGKCMRARRPRTHLMAPQVTYEHEGIFEAVDDAYQSTGEIRVADVRDQLDKNVGLKRPVGTVVAATANGGFIARIDPRLPLVTDAIRRRIFSVSLTHVGETLDPLELSLVRDPARTAASIRASYKGDTLPFDKTRKLLTMADAPTSTPAAPMEQETPAEPPAAVSPIEAALSLLEPEARAVLETQLRNYETQAQRQEKALEELEKAQTQDRDIATALANDLMEKFRAQGLELPLGMPSNGAGIHESPFDRRRFIEACSRAFASREAAPAPAAPVEAAAPAPAAPAVSEEPPAKRSRGRHGATDGDALVRAFMRKFD